MMMNNHVEGSRHVVDALSLGVVVGTLADALPSIAALLSIFWTLLRVFEGSTCQRLIARLRGRPRAD